jgi:hypothetical protein
VKTRGERRASDIHNFADGGREKSKDDVRVGDLRAVGEETGGNVKGGG